MPCAVYRPLQGLTYLQRKMYILTISLYAYALYVKFERVCMWSMHARSHLQLLTGGSDGLQHWSINGSLLLKAPCTPNTVLSLSMLTMPSTSQEVSVTHRHKYSMCTACIRWCGVEEPVVCFCCTDSLCVRRLWCSGCVHKLQLQGFLSGDHVNHVHTHTHTHTSSSLHLVH